MSVSHNSSGQGSSASAFAITPSDTVDLTYPTRAIYVGVGGNLAVIMGDDSAAVTLVGVIAGKIYPFAVKRVMVTNTTATTLVGIR